MKKIILFILISISWNCTRKKALKIEDLNFSDIDQKYILQNNIKKTFLISGTNTWNYKKSDTIGIDEYNMSGNMIKKWRKGFFNSSTEKNEYDSLGLLKRKFFLPILMLNLTSNLNLIVIA